MLYFIECNFHLMSKGMSKIKLSEEDLLKDLTSHTSHADEVAAISEKDWGNYSENTDKADDVFDESRMEAMVKMAERFNKNGALDDETLKRIKKL